MEKTDMSLQDAINRAERYCSAAEHCEAEVVRKLYQWGAEEHKETVIAHLRDNGYIDDDRYCEAFAHDHLNINHWAPLKIKMALIQRHLPSESIRKVLGDLQSNSLED